jgi:hypothetical protein
MQSAPHPEREETAPMLATAAPAASDRSDVRTVTVGGALVGATTALAVVLVVATSRLLAGSPSVAGGVEALVVLVAATLVAFVPGQRTAARSTEGIAGAAALGLVGTVVFSAIDIVALRPLKAYPWTWDAIGGGSTWWYLPIWWMLGTFLAWMGGIVTARSAPGNGTLLRLAGPTIAGTVLVTALARLAGLAVPLPVATGGAFTLVLAALALVALARTG